MKTAALSILMITLSFASAAQYPVHPIRLIVPFSSGGPADILARAIGEDMTRTLRQQIVVDDRPGAGGNIGAELAKDADADGYTLLLIATAHAINKTLYHHLSYDLERDFAPLSLVGTAPHVLVVSPSVPAHTVNELIALARQKPGALNFASSGNGTPGHLAGEFLTMRADINIVHVPYKGGGPAAADLMAGHVQMFFDNIASARPYVKAGRARALAVTSAARCAELPAVPTMIESGLKDFEITSWFGMVTRAGTPAPATRAITGALSRALNSTAVRKQLALQGATITQSSPAEFERFMRAEVDKWAALVKASGARID
jgi:tripartite-type tricarboxylate transporter receptor subunit TctC